MCPLGRILLTGSLFKQTRYNSCGAPVTAVSWAFWEVLSPKSDTFGQGYQSVWKPHDLAAVISLPDPNYRKLASEVKKLAHVATLATCRGVRMHASEQLGSFTVSLHQQKLHGWSCKHSSALHSNTIRNDVISVTVAVSGLHSSCLHLFDSDVRQLPPRSSTGGVIDGEALPKLLNDPSRLYPGTHDSQAKPF